MVFGYHGGPTCDQQDYRKKRQVQCVAIFIYFSQFVSYHLVVTGDLKNGQ
jgi:hypothetical protein